MCVRLSGYQLHIPRLYIYKFGWCEWDLQHTRLNNPVSLRIYERHTKIQMHTCTSCQFAYIAFFALISKKASSFILWLAKRARYCCAQREVRRAFAQTNKMTFGIHPHIYSYSIIIYRPHSSTKRRELAQRAPSIRTHKKWTSRRTKKKYTSQTPYSPTQSGLMVNKRRTRIYIQISSQSSLMACAVAYHLRIKMRQRGRVKFAPGICIYKSCAFHWCGCKEIIYVFPFTTNFYSICTLAALRIMRYKGSRKGRYSFDDWYRVEVV